MLKVGSFQVGAIILCEMIRPELYNKLILLGVFSADICVPVFPYTIQVTPYIELHPTKKGQFRIEYRFVNSLGPAANLEIEVCVEETTRVTAIPLPLFLVPIQAPGEIHLELKSGNSDWVRVLSRQVSLGQF